MFESIYKYLIDNPLELPAFALSIFTFCLIKRKHSATQAKIILDIVHTTNTPFYQLKIFHPEQNINLFVTEIPTISRRKFFLYKKINFLVDYSVQINQKTNEKIPFVYYIHLNRFDKLEKGKYLIKVKVSYLPYTLRYKVHLPFSS